jgi:hypothetical protein
MTPRERLRATLARRPVDRVLGALRGRPGFIPTLDPTVPPDVSLRNFLCYLDCVRSYEL